MTSKIYTPNQEQALKRVFSNLPNPKAFTVYGNSKGDIRNPQKPTIRWTGSWTLEKCSNLLSITDALSLLDKIDGLSGIALCFYPNCGYGALDYDKCGAEFTEASDSQKEVFNLISTAPCEISKSGSGLHQFFIANGESQKDNGHLELFMSNGYVCLTGDFKGEAQALPEYSDDIIQKISAIIKPPRAIEKAKHAAIQGQHNESFANALALLHNCNPNSTHDEWVNICFAFQASYPLEDGYEQFDKFSQGGQSYDPQSTRSLWESYNPSRSNHSLGTLIYEANKFKGVPFNLGAQTKSAISTLNDAGNAERLAARLKNRFLYVPELKTWLYWQDDYWQADLKGFIKKAAIEVAKAIFNEAAQADPQLAPKIAAWANASLQKGHIDAMIELAKPLLSVSVSELDKNPMMLGVKNGVIDLRTGTFRPALPEDLMTQQCNVTYDPNASAPLWKQFILQVSNGDVDLATYKQLCWGYSLTGETSEQCFFFLYGWGCNGKSTETGAMQELMGSYAKTISSNVLMVKHNYGNQGPTPEIARLVGARLVTANETEDGARLAEAQIKAMTGQDMLTARVLQGNPFDFKPKFKLFISGNHKPVIRGEDDGIWRRIKVIPFDMQVKDTDVDKQLFQKLMAEKSGILNWAIQGCLLWQENGKLLEPQIVKTEVASYRSDQDIMGAWLEEKCVLTPEKQCSTRELFINYSDWVRASGSNPVTETRFSTRLIERGFTKQRINQKMTFIGIGLIRQFN